MKKISSKRRQKAKKLKTKAKLEAEKSPEDEFSELEKEILIIKINELESKVNRKHELCTSLKEENKLYKTFYDKEIKAKKNSTKLLNCAYEELSTEILLLEDELIAMEFKYNKLLEDREFCVEAKSRVNKLSRLKTVLDAKFSEAEKCPAQNIELGLKLDELQKENALNTKKYEEEKASVHAEFQALTKGLQDDMTATIVRLIDDKSLKLNLLPIPYQGLFLSGMEETTYLDSALKHIEKFLSENIQLEKHLVQTEIDTLHVRQSLSKLASKIIISTEVLDYLCTQSTDTVAYNKVQKEEAERKFVIQIENHLADIQKLKAKISFEERRIADLEAKLREQEKEIKLKEVQDKESIKNIQLATIIKLAGDIIRREVQVISSL